MADSVSSDRRYFFAVLRALPVGLEISRMGMFSLNAQHLMTFNFTKSIIFRSPCSKN